MRIIAVLIITLICASTSCAETYVDAVGKMKMHIGAKDASPEVPEYTDPGNIIQTETGRIFVIVLDANATTGYEWQIEQPFDKLALEAIGKEYVKGSSDMPGAGGKEKWTFRALAFRRGYVPLSFKYIRPWEKDVQAAKEVTFKVIINKGPAERQLESMQKSIDKMRNESWTEHLGQ